MKEQIVFDKIEYENKVKDVSDRLKSLYNDMHLQLQLNLRNMTEEKARKLTDNAYYNYSFMLSQFKLKNGDNDG